jgi:hypothetical protein
VSPCPNAVTSTAPHIAGNIHCPSFWTKSGVPACALNASSRTVSNSLLCVWCSDSDAALQSADGEAATLCRSLLSQAPSLEEASDVLAPRPSYGLSSKRAVHTQQLATIWPALLQAATLPHSTAATSQDLLNLLQVPARRVAVQLRLCCLSPRAV